MLISCHRVLNPFHCNQTGQASKAECYESITTACEAKHIKRASFYKNVQEGRAEVDGWIITYGETERNAGASDSESNGLTGKSADMVYPPCPLLTVGSTETIGILSQPSAVPLPRRTVTALPSRTSVDAASSNGTSDSNDLPNTMRADNNHASNNDDAAGNDTVIDTVIDKGGVVDDDVQEYHETTFVDSQSEEDDEDDNDIEFLPSEGMFDEPF